MMNLHQHHPVDHRPPDVDGGSSDRLSWPLDGVDQWQVGTTGWLAVEGAAVWLTRDGDLDDHVLKPGQGMHLRPGDRITVEPWCRDTRARLVWSPAAAAQLERVLRAAGLARFAGARWRLALAG
jgi:Protein of unknown function (DUF2917)